MSPGKLRSEKICLEKTCSEKTCLEKTSPEKICLEKICLEKLCPEQMPPGKIPGCGQSSVRLLPNCAIAKLAIADWQRRYCDQETGVNAYPGMAMAPHWLRMAPILGIHGQRFPALSSR
jgi:hypothetical protein